MTLAVIYSRISHDPEGRQAGVERQEQDCRHLAAERGWQVLEPVYRENDVSASTRSKKRRPVFEQMLSDLSDARALHSSTVAWSARRTIIGSPRFERARLLVVAFRGIAAAAGPDRAVRRSALRDREGPS